MGYRCKNFAALVHDGTSSACAIDPVPMKIADVARYVFSPAVAWWKKVFGIAALVYLVFPFDIVPDTIPILGWLDDVGLLAAAISLIARDVAKHAKQAPLEK